MTALDTSRAVAVVGAGTMGTGIAQTAAAAGHPVLLFDTRPEAVDRSLAQLHTTLERVVVKGRMTAAVKSALLGRITPCRALAELKPAGLVVEAIVEDLAAKRDLFAELETLLAHDAVMATNTSSISVTALGAGLGRPERLVGMHFFNPVPLMALVEVVSGLATDPIIAADVFDTASAWGKSPVHARSTPGFIVNRVAQPFYAEALRLLQERAATPETLDAIMRDCGGFRMGPFELMDLIGHDVNYAVTRSVFDAYFQDPRFTPSLIQQELVEAGRLGCKSGQGFYRYDGTDRPAPDTAAPAAPPARVVARGELGPLNELVALLPEAGIGVRRADSGSDDGLLELDNRVMVALTDGRSATERMAVDVGRPLVHVDLALDYARSGRLALAPADRCPIAERDLAVGLLQAAGKAVSVIDDVPGMLVMRTVCMLANQAADAVNQGVCDSDSVDTAMCKGVNYPRGPLAWARQIGLERVIKVLNHLIASYGEDRYRVSPWLRRNRFAQSGLRATLNSDSNG